MKWFLNVEAANIWLQLNDAPLAIVDKRRSSHNVSEVMNLIGDVKGKVAVLVDDMIDTAGTITNAAKVFLIPSCFTPAHLVLSLMALCACCQQAHAVSCVPSWCLHRRLLDRMAKACPICTVNVCIVAVLLQCINRFGG